MNVVDEILAERRRQIGKGWTPEHDDLHNNGAIADAAGCYALLSSGHYLPNLVEKYKLWPWTELPKRRPPRDNLIIAAALIVAEIERLDRVGSSAYLKSTTE